MAAGAALLHRDVAPSVLVIDDDSDIRAYLDDVLRLEGFAVTTLADPRRAVAQIRRRRFHILVIDLMMPHLDGLSLLAQVRAFDRRIPIILVSSAPASGTIREAIGLGISAYLEHPLMPDKLRDAVFRIMARGGVAS